MSQLPEYEVEEFKALVHKWLSIDDDIRRLKKAEKDLNEAKKALTPQIVEFMSKNSIEDCNTTNGKLKCSVSHYKKPINRKFLTEKLGTFMNNSKRGEEITAFLLDNRETEEKINLRRTFMRKKGE
jgi:hypothetical protein